MGNLRDQLKKAKLLSTKDAKRLAHEERVKRSTVGREGLEKEQAQRRAEIERLREEERERTRRVQEEHEEARRAAEELAACQVLVQSARPPERGPIKWYFELEDGHLPFLEIRETGRRQLEAHAVCVVRKGPPGTHVYGLLDSRHAERLKNVLPDVLVWT